MDLINPNCGFFRAGKSNLTSIQVHSDHTLYNSENNLINQLIQTSFHYLFQSKINY